MMVMLVSFLLSCSGVEIAEGFTNLLEELNKESAAEWEAGRPEREEEVEAYLATHELDLMKPQDIKRVMFQEWLDHQQRAWVPVAVVTDVFSVWPQAVRATQITVTQSEVLIRTATEADAQAIKARVQDSSWVQDVTVSEKMVTGQVTAVKRQLAPESDTEVSAEVKRLSDSQVLGSSPTVADRNFVTSLANESDAFNCWRRVQKKRERFQRMDGTWVEGGTVEVRPEKPTVLMAQWVDLSETEQGRAWTRKRASVELRGPFPALVQGLDCAKKTGARYSVRTIDFVTDPVSNGGAILAFTVDLLMESVWAQDRQTPWAEDVTWGSAAPPERRRTLKDQKRVNPFAE